MANKNDKSKEDVVVKKVKKKKNKLLNFFLGFLFIIFVFLAGAYIYANGLLKDDRNSKISGEIDSGLKENNLFSDLFKLPSKKINFVILGVDEDGTRTDLMVLGRFDSDTNKIHLISIPRDTYVEFTKEEEKLLIDNGRYIPSKGFLKLNEVHSYAGPEMGTDFIVRKLEKLFNIKIEYYVKINLEGFRQFIDNVGGIEFDVPQRMIYNDPIQDLHIDLNPGIQVLNGKQAEGLIRYRKSDYGKENESPSYANGDLKRVEVQQEFIKATMTQIMSKSKIMDTIPSLFKAMGEYVSTNFNINEFPKYSKYFKNITPDNIITHTLPVVDKVVNGYSYSYVAIDKEKTRELINEVYYFDENTVDITSKGKNIQVLNGGFTKGMAKKTSEMLEENGIAISEIADFDGTKHDETYIYVKENGMGRDLIKYFPDAVINVDSSYGDFDITIIIGTDFIIN